MQTIGTEWGRKCVGGDVWLRLARAQVERAWGEGKRVVVDDVRFLNEADAIEAMGGFLIRVDRPGLVAGSHPSEQEQARIVAHWTVRNEGDLIDLETALTSAFVFARHTAGIAAWRTPNGGRHFNNAFAHALLVKSLGATAKLSQAGRRRMSLSVRFRCCGFPPAHAGCRRDAQRCSPGAAACPRRPIPRPPGRWRTGPMSSRTSGPWRGPPPGMIAELGRGASPAGTVGGHPRRPAERSRSGFGRGVT
ncbi:MULTISPECIES: hypothetical protein [Methylobacterium]